MIDWLQSSLISAGWQVSIQTGEYQSVPITNVIAHQGSKSPSIIFGAHYDTRLYADKDPNPSQRLNPVPGANDGASGVAVLLEIARVLPDNLSQELWLVMFDAEDNGNITGWDWILGSRYFVENLKNRPEAMVLVDMVGDRDLQLYHERYSDQKLTSSIWATAQKLGYDDIFIPREGYAILDDHIPFVEIGVPSVNVIDFDYPYHHTIEDTIDKVSATSLKIVGETLLVWLEDHAK
jgi:Zn-dependent M28 family amino/carboxypeptidase